MKDFVLTKIDRLKLISICIKSLSGVVGGSLILSEHKPYLTLSVLALGAVANEVVAYIREKERENENTNSDTTTP